MSTAQLKLLGENQFARAFAAFDDVVHHGQQPDRLREELALCVDMVEELARREL